MKSFTYVITDKDGIHARPAGTLVKEAVKYQSDIMIKKGDNAVDAKRIFSVMSLAAKKNDSLIVECTGEDEQQAVEAIKEILKKYM